MTWSRVGALWFGSLGFALCGAAPAGSGRWSHIDFVEYYAFKGEVLEHEDLSGIACISQTRCLLGADEAHEVQVVGLSRKDKTLTVLQTLSLMSKGDEIDIEAIAADGDSYYIIGSHGVAKKTGRHQPNRYRIFRLRANRTAGGPAVPEMASLSGVLRADSVLGKYFGKPLQQRGVNIEGLAIRDGQLFVGLRNPNVAGDAHVLEIAAEDVFAGKKDPAYTLHKLPLGRGLGIREIVAARSGFLIIAGNAGSEPSDVFPTSADYDKGRGYWMYAWDGESSDIDKIGRIPNTPGKAEAMTILSETDDEATVLVLFDGAKRGRPSVYRIY